MSFHTVKGWWAMQKQQVAASVQEDLGPLVEMAVGLF